MFKLDRVRRSECFWSILFTLLVVALLINKIPEKDWTHFTVGIVLFVVGVQRVLFWIRPLFGRDLLKKEFPLSLGSVSRFKIEPITCFTRGIVFFVFEPWLGCYYGAVQIEANGTVIERLELRNVKYSSTRALVRMGKVVALKIGDVAYGTEINAVVNLKAAEQKGSVIDRSQSMYPSFEILVRGKIADRVSQ